MDMPGATRADRKKRPAPSGGFDGWQGRLPAVGDANRGEAAEEAAGCVLVWAAEASATLAGWIRQPRWGLSAPIGPSALCWAEPHRFPDFFDVPPSDVRSPTLCLAESVIGQPEADSLQPPLRDLTMCERYACPVTVVDERRETMTGMFLLAAPDCRIPFVATPCRDDCDATSWDFTRFGPKRRRVGQISPLSVYFEDFSKAKSLQALRIPRFALACGSHPVRDYERAASSLTRGRRRSSRIHRTVHFARFVFK
ncbi:hypothetical protein CPSG_03453 [Coccidioides posadasii str. Silveira]|uniref:Uncharacterized protein n=1 Tax=Coccidioides posadasii (strain RMSCC 757 / Silveira) TaxID=443226 RepID=E9D025_COCPS|nr:hypothetical protein CPSG_03453 [Coccidioides posadasii str. Silveira]